MNTWRQKLGLRLLAPPTRRQITTAAKWWITGIVVAQAGAIASVITADWLRRRRQSEPDSFLTAPPRSVRVAASEVTTYTDAHALYDAMLAAIRQAKNRVYFETYIWKSDQWGQAFKDELLAAARRGVDVRIIYDALGNLVVDPRFFRFPRLRKLQVLRIPVFNRGMLSFSPRHFGRDHRKILVVDSTTGFVGGYNIGGLYRETWRDTHVQITGPSVWELDNAFTDFWNLYRNNKHTPLPDRGAREWDARIRVAQNSPAKLLFPVRGLYIDACDRAVERIWITQAYFIPDQEIMGSLIAAARRGVDVKVLIPEISNHVVADWVARAHFTRLLESGVEIWLYQGAMIHAKTATVDGRWATVGTANIDRLSLTGNHEINLEFVSKRYASVMEGVFRRDLSQSRRLTWSEWQERPYLHRLGERLLRPLAPLM